MRAFADLARRQLTADLRDLPARAARGDRARRRREAQRSIADVREAARRALPRTIFDFVDGAAGDEVAAARNRRDLEALELWPRYPVDVLDVDTSTTVLGTRVATPLLGAPAGLLGLVHHEGELGMARAVHGAGSIYVLPTTASYAIDEVATGAPGPTWFQLYLWKDRGFVVELLQRARAAGLGALVVTVDGPRTGRRERDLRNGFGVPPRVGARAAGEGLRHPRWAWSFVRHGRFVMAQQPAGAGRDVGSLAQFFARQFDASLTWNDIAWLRGQWDGPLVVKGLLHPADAVLAADVGAEAVVVSNHGGRQLDEAPSSIRALPRVVDAVGDRVEVLLDSGVRRGGDVVKALALGARACLAGRALVFGLAAGGSAGARHAFDLLAREVELTLALSGCPSVAAITPELLDPEVPSRAAVPD